MRKRLWTQFRIGKKGARRAASRPGLEAFEARLLLTTFVVQNTNDDTAPGSFRWAINQTNQGRGGDTIAFSIPGSGAQTIALHSALPTLNVGVTIDGTTQPDFSGAPLIQLDGTDAGQGADGLDLTGDNSAVIGLAINGFSGNGITISAGSNTRIQGNFIGMLSSGSPGSGNGGSGVLVSGGQLEQIGGDLPGQRNLISLNGRYGVEFNGKAAPIQGAIVSGNLIGTDLSGTLKEGNLLGGIAVSNANGTTIGGEESGDGNVISGNVGPGITALGSTDGLRVQGNWIGTDPTGIRNVGNLGGGVRLLSSNNVIGGLLPGDPNIIAFNGDPRTGNGPGVGLDLNVSSGTILSNAIFANAGAGIDLGSGANHQLANPTMTAVSTDGSSTTVIGSFSGAPNATYIVQFFANDSMDSSGFGEGQFLLGTRSVTTDAAGNGVINVTLPGAVSSAQYVTATLTDPQGNTSQFGRDLMADGTADLSVGVSASSSSVNVGENVTYHITVTNVGSTTAHDLLITNLLPAGVTIVSITDAFATISQGSSSFLASLGVLGPGMTHDMMVVVKTSSASVPSLLDTVTVGCSDGDSNASNNVASVSTPIGVLSDLTVTAQADHPSVAMGTPVTYTVTVTNHGPTTATGVTLIDSLPAGVTIVSAVSNQTDATTTIADGVITTLIGTLAADGSSFVLTIVVSTSTSTPPSIILAASVSSDEVDPNPADDSASVTTTVTPAFDLGVVVGPLGTPVLLGQDLVYSIVVTNHGALPVTGVELKGHLPAGLTVVSATDSLGTVVPVGSDGSFDDFLGTMDGNASATLTIKVVPQTAGPIVLTAAVAGDQTDPDTTNNTIQVTTGVLPVADLGVSFAPLPPNALTGRPITYTLIVSNRGPSPAVGVSLTGMLPSGAVMLSAGPGPGLFSASQGAFSANLGTLAPNASMSYTLTLMPGLAGLSTISTTISSSAFDPDTGNNLATEAVNVMQPPGTLQFSAPTFSVGDNGGVAVITVTRTDGTQGTVSVNYWSDGGSAASGPDYQAVSGTLVFGPGESTKTFSVPVRDNPYNRADHSVNLVLGTPTGGADLGPLSSATLVIKDLNPDNVAPQVEDLRLAGPATGIDTVTLVFNKTLDPATASNPANYHVVAVGADGWLGTGDDSGVGLSWVSYDPTTNSVTLQPNASLGSNQFYHVQIAGVTDPGGLGIAGGAYNGFFGRGTFLSYPDSHGTLVTFMVKGGGVLDLTRYANGDGQRLQLLNPVPRRTSILGVVQGSASTSLDSITGLGAFGQVKLRFNSPPILVANMPFAGSFYARPAVDIIYGMPINRGLRIRARGFHRPMLHARRFIFARHR
ncbi:Calx-beta domain-containing protein [Singulisphaera rosea]